MTLRRELRKKIEDTMQSRSDAVDQDLVDLLTDAVLEVRGIAKVNLPVDWAIAAGVSSKEIANIASKEQAEKDKAEQFERAMGYNPLDWWTNNDLKALLRFLMDKTEEQIKTFAAWSRGKYSTLQPPKIRQNPRLAIDCWNMAFQEAPDQDNSVRARLARERMAQNGN